MEGLKLDKNTIATCRVVCNAFSFGHVQGELLYSYDVSAKCCQLPLFLNCTCRCSFLAYLIFSINMGVVEA